MSDLTLRKSPIITIEPNAESKKLEETKEKFSSVKRSGKISVGTSPLSKDSISEFSIREGSSLKKLRISSSPEEKAQETAKPERALKPNTLAAKKNVKQEGQKLDLAPKVDLSAAKRTTPNFSPEFSGNKKPQKVSSYFSDDIKVKPRAQQETTSESTLDILPDLNTYRLSSVVGAALTGIWFLVAAIYAQFYMGLGEIFTQQPHIIGGFLAGVLAPVALLWMIIAHIQRGDEVRQYAVALRNELRTLSFSNTNKTKEPKQRVDITEESKAAVTTIHKARAGLRSDIKYLNDVSEKTGAQLSKLNNTLSDRAAKLLDMSQQIEKRTASLDNLSISPVASVKGAPADAHETASNILEKTDGLTQKMDERIKSLTSVLGKMEGTLGNIESKGSTTADKLAKAVADSSSNVTSLESAIKNSIEKLTKASAEAKGQAEGLIETSAKKVIELNQTGEKTSEAITSVLGMIDKSREKIENTSKTMDQQASDITKAQDGLGKRIDDMQLRISEPLAAVNRAVDKAVNKHGEMGQELDKRIEALNEASDKAVTKTDSIREGLRSQTQEMSTLMGQIAGHSRSVKSMLKDESENLAENVMAAVEKVNSVGDALRGQSDKLSGVTASAEERITKVSDVLSKQSINAVQDTGRVISDFKTIEAIVTDNVKSLISQSVEAKTSVNEAAVELGKSAKIIEPIYIKATNHIDQTRDRFEKMASGFETRTNGNINKLKAFETVFDERLKTLSSSAEDASNILERSSDSLGARVDDIDNATSSAQEKLQNIDTLFKNHVSDIHLTTDQALLKIDVIQKAMNTHYQDLSASVAESLAQMKDVGEQFVSQTQAVQKLSIGAVEGLDKAGNKANEKIKGLNKLAQTTTGQMEAMIQKVQSEAELLLSTSTKALSQMKKTGEDFASRAKLVEEQMKNSAVNTKKYGEDFDKQADKVSKTSQRSATDIEKAMAQLAQKLLDVKQVSKDVTDEVTSSRDKLSSETEHLADVSLKAARVVEEAATSYVHQSGSLNKATAEAASHIDKVREGDWRVQRDAFLNGTRFILESLHSLSVDLTRMVDGDIQEKIWKAYQKGDIAAFTRRLIENKEKLPHDKMTAKYADDNEFRTYINRFIRQFEDLYEQASSNDYGELISATFASSDVAALYDILCDVAGRQSLIKKLSRKAA